MVIDSSCNPLRKAYATNVTSASATSKFPVQVLPSNDGFHQVSHPGAVAPSILGVIPYAVASDDHTFSLRIWGWQECAFQVGSKPIYVPRLLLEVDLVCGQAAGTVIESGTLFPDTITDAGGDDTARIVSPGSDAANTIGHFLVDLSGSRWIEFDAYKNSGSVTSMNALWWTLS